jgi:hypothetical protein
MVAVMMVLVLALRCLLGSVLGHEISTNRPNFFPMVEAGNEVRLCEMRKVSEVNYHAHCNGTLGSVYTARRTGGSLCSTRASKPSRTASPLSAHGRIELANKIFSIQRHK